MARLLLLVHQGLAVATATPELGIVEAEANMLAKPTVDILEEFDLKPDPRFEKGLALLLACGFVYGPRVVIIRERLAREAAERKAQGMRHAGSSGPASSSAAPEAPPADPGAIDPAVMEAAAQAVAGMAG